MLKILKCPNLPNPVFSGLKRAHRCRGPPDIKRSGSTNTAHLINQAFTIRRLPTHSPIDALNLDDSAGSSTSGFDPDITEIAGVSGGATNVSDSSGLGVRVSNIRRSFDSYLSDKTRTSQSDYEMLNDFVSKLSALENMLLPSGSDLGVFIGRFFDSLQDAYISIIP